MAPLVASPVAFAQAPVPLAPASAAARAPHIKAVGGSTAVSWIETAPEGVDVLRMAVLFDALPPTTGSPMTFTMDVAGAATLGDSDVAVDPATERPAMVWVAETEEGAEVRFASPGAAPEVVFRSPRFLELPALDFDGEGTAYAAWAEVDGGVSRIHAAVRPVGGPWSSATVSDAARSYDVLPQVFANATGAELYWFTMTGDDVLARLALLTRTGVSADTSGTLGDVPANRLPTIYRVTEDQRLGFLWLEQASGGEIYFDIDPRVPAAELPLVLGGAAVTVSSPAVSEDASAGKVWLESDAQGAQQLVVRRGDGREERRAISRTAREPVIAVSDRWTHVAWTEENLLGAGGSLYYMRLP